MIINIDNVSKTIKKIPIITDVSLTLKPGVITGLKGINGSGKTMIMRLVSGLIRPTEGKIMFGDKELWKDISFPESIGVLIENPAFIDYFSGFENLIMLADIKNKITSEDIRKTIETVGLDPDDKKKYKLYSLGMKQRLGIACAIMEHPDVIVLDEPTNALDTDGIEMVKKVLVQEKERGAIILLSCHDYGILKELSDEIYFIENGMITGYEGKSAE